MSYSVAIAFTVTKDGQPYHNTVMRYDDLDYANLVLVEQQAIGLVNSLGELGKKRLAEKSGPSK